MLANKSIRLIKSDFASVVSMALIYIVLGKLSLLLAIPPGHATAMFLPAGLAIAAVLLWGGRLLPGIFLGSLILHLWVNLEAGHPLFSTATLVALGIAIGALLQTVVAVALVRFYVSSPTELSGEKEIVCFLLLAGPVASFIGASIGISALLFGGVIAPGAFLFGWLTWWVGDVIGVVIMAPLLLIFFAQPRQLWRQRVLTVAIPMLVSCVVVVVVFVRVSQSELERLEFQFRGESVEILEAVKSRFDGYVEELAALERFYAASTFVTRDEFRSFVSPALLRSPGLQVLEWLPRVPDSQRQQFESQMRNSGFFQYHLTEHDASQSLVAAGVRDEYFPVAYVEPYPGNEAAIGYDVASNAISLAALVQARDNGTVGVSAPIELLKFGAEQKGALLFFPLYENGDLPVTIALRQERLKGFMLAVFGYRYMLDAALMPFPKDTFLLSVLDVSDASSAVPLYGDESIVLNNNKQTVSWSGTISAGGRSLLLNFTPSAKYLDQHRTWQAWMVLAWGLLFTSILGALLLIISGRSRRVQQLVDRQTLELRATLECLLEAIITFDSNGVIESVNPAAQQLLGYSNIEILGMPLTRFIPDVARYERAEWLVKQHFFGKHNETVATHRDGSALPIEFGVSEVIMPERIFYTGTIRDLRERKQAEQINSEFIVTVGRELRGPITAIRGAVGLIDGAVMDAIPQPVMKLLKTVTTNSVHLVNLINDISDIKRLEFGEARFEMRHHEISALVKKTLELNSSITREHQKSLRFQQELALAPRWVDVDEQYFIQAMAQLLSNAVKFSSAAAEVTVAVVIMDGDVEVQVIDHGQGIAEADRDKVFEKFWQVDASHDHTDDGTGLGLSIVKAIIEKMGGEVGFTSVVGEGTTFYIRLPIVK